ARCSTYLAGDVVPSNDTLSNSFTVQVKDVGVTAIEVPTGTIDSTGSAIIPRARVKNFGTNPRSFNVTFKFMGPSYSHTRSKTLGAGVEDTVNFQSWVPVRGSYQARCSTYLAGDAVPSNDTLTSAFTVRVRDVGVTLIEVPTGTIDSTGTAILPRARVKNFGTTTETFNVTFKIIGTSYSHTRSKTLVAGVAGTVNFQSWVPARGSYQARCSTYLTGDVVPSNDMPTSAFTVQVKDVGVTAIEYPIGTIDSTGSVIPRARVKNFGSDSITFQVTFKIGGIYSNSRTKKLNTGIEDTVNFAPWFSPRGTYSVRCSTYVAGDINNSNDTLSSSVTVIVNDVGVTAITSPPDTIYRGSLQPKATVKNFGTQQATFYTYFKIFDQLANQVYLDSSL
ncbi:MAG: hypothetical protein N2748_04395, partial [candidate division WOR-3 bacterium]|nr:hypothetical protein [candidate division WOR-3 bacterium]